MKLKSTNINRYLHRQRNLVDPVTRDQFEVNRFGIPEEFAPSESRPASTPYAFFLLKKKAA